jgi:hypothetical protein
MGPDEEHIKIDLTVTGIARNRRGDRGGIPGRGSLGNRGRILRRHDPHQ